MKSKSLMARALYDNVPESHEELAFRKGDILTVLEQNTGGLKGWWLCSLHGRQGIAPGNRLKLLIGPMCEAAHDPAHQAISPSGHQSSDQAPEGLYQVPTTRLNICRVAPSSHVPYTGQEVYQVAPNSHLLHSGQDVYQVPPRGHLSYSRQEVYQGPQRLNSKVVNPVCGGHSCAHEPLQQDVYDVPPFRLQGLYPVPPFREASSLQEENYDFPKPTKLRTEGIYNVVPAATIAKPCLHPNYAFLPSSAPTLPYDSDTYDVPPSQHLSGTLGNVYDIPRGTQPAHHRASPYLERNLEKEVYNVPSSDPRPLCDLVDGMNRLSVSSNGSTRSSMTTSSTSTASKDSIAPCSRQAMDLDLAVQRLGYLQQGVEASVSALLALASNPRWRTIESLQRHPHEVRMALERVCQVLTDFVSFSREYVGGASALSNPSLHGKLHRQLQRLEDSQQILRQVIQALDACGWSVVALAGAVGHRCNDLDRFIMVSRTLPDDVKQLASTIGSNAVLLFSSATCNGSFSESSVVVEDGIYSCLPEKDQTKPFPVTCILEEDENSDGSNNGEKCVKSWMEDYDYVHLQGKEEFERQQKELLEKENIIKQNKIQLEHEQLIQLKQLEQEVNRPVENDINQWISMKLAAGSSLSSFPVSGVGARRCEWDRQLLCFYSEQCEAHFVTLLNAVDAFFSCVAAGQPPRIFVAHSKLVILSAHKLVFVGDTLSRQAESPEVQGRAVEGSNAMCQLLKAVVGATKTAAQRFPSTAAIQEMVDRVTDLSHRAQQFKVQLQQMAAF